MQELTVGQYTLRIDPFGTKKGLEVLTKLFNLFGPAAIRTLGDKDTYGALELVFEKIDFETVNWLIEVFSEKTQVNLTEKGWIALSTGEAIFETVFGNDYFSILRWLRAGLELNYADFFGSIGGALTAGKIPSEFQKK
jgi:hypothetical protein